MTRSTFDPKLVFSQRVENYIKYRPGYPVEMLDILVKECGLTADWRVADVGSGTGLLLRLFLDFGCSVIGVEPNAEMRCAGDQILSGYPYFTSMPGSAESTGLEDKCVDLVSAGMALHWFDLPRARDEFRRILTPPGWIAVVWHRMLTGPELFMERYTSLVQKYSPGWTETQRRDQPGSSINLPGFFGGDYRRATFPTRQIVDWNGLSDRTLSIAHAPQPGDSNYQSMFDELGEIFIRHEVKDHVTLEYETELYYGRLL